MDGTEYSQRAELNGRALIVFVPFLWLSIQFSHAETSIIDFEAPGACSSKVVGGYIPVNYATKGRRYTLYTSTDLSRWTWYREISEYEARPRFWCPLSEAGPRVYFKIEESLDQ